MADRAILYRLRAALQGGKVAVASEVELLQTYPGVVIGANNVETALQRIDGTGVGAAIFTFAGTYAATAANINQWFGGRQQNRLRCTDDGAIFPLTFTLPGTTALNTAFDTLETAGLPEVLRFVIEYTGPSTTFLSVRPNTGGPQIGGVSSIPVRTGIAATLEITRTDTTISDYVFQAIGGIGDTSGGTLDAIKLISPTDQIWDASSTGVLPSTGVVKGNAYRVANAPSDGSGRFGEVMQNNDWVVWEGDTFTAWSSEPHLWFVIPAHEVRRITALERDFLTDVTVTPVSDRNTAVRGVDYSTTPGASGIRLKIYDTQADYDAADLNTTGDVDEYEDPADQSGYFAIRLNGTQATLANVLPTLYVYSDDGSDNFIRFLNLDRDFTHQGDFGLESDYLSNETIDYLTGTTLRVYVAQTLDRFTHPNLDIFESNLSTALQGKVNGREAWASIADILFSGASVKDIHIADLIEYSPGYNLGVDWRDMAQTTTINANRYIDSALNISVNAAAFTLTGFGNTLQKIIGINLQRNDAQTGEGALIEIGSGLPFLRVNTSNQIQINTVVGAATPVWSSLVGAAGAITLGAGSNNFLIFEMVPSDPSNPSGNWRVVGVFYNGSTYDQLNDITFTPSGNATGDNLGFSRSSIQRGQVLQFKAINSPGYLFHSTLEQILRQHQDDKWDFGYARLIEGSDRKEVVLQTAIITPNTVTGTAAPTVAPVNIGDTFIDTVNKKVYRAIGTATSGDWEVLN